MRAAADQRPNRTCSSGNEANFRTSAYEALASYVTHASPDTIPVVQNTAVTVLARMEQLLAMQVSDSGSEETAIMFLRGTFISESTHWD